jgi:hypothetical protein
VGPRLFGIPASAADVVGVIRRGPSAWCAVGRWDVRAGTYDHGAWLRGTIYPQRCDVSPDGSWLVYFALQPSAAWDLGWTFVAVSRLPWLHALAAWGTDGTWSRGCHFVAEASSRVDGEPEHGSLPYDLLGAGLALTGASSYAVERRRGWSEAPGAPPRDPSDVWDERRADTLRMTKAQPGSSGAVRLEVTGRQAAFRSGASGGRARYSVADGGGRLELPDVQWADWASDGSLLVATRSGRLETRGAASWANPDAVVADLAAAEPAPAAPPPEALSWT